MKQKSLAAAMVLAVLASAVGAYAAKGTQDNSDLNGPQSSSGIKGQAPAPAAAAVPARAGTRATEVITKEHLRFDLGDTPDTKALYPLPLGLDGSIVVDNYDDSVKQLSIRVESSEPASAPQNQGASGAPRAISKTYPLGLGQRAVYSFPGVKVSIWWDVETVEDIPHVILYAEGRLLKSSQSGCLYASVSYPVGAIVKQADRYMVCAKTQKGEFVWTLAHLIDGK